MHKKIIFIICLCIFLAGCSSVDEFAVELLGDAISNSGTIESIRINSNSTVSFNDELAKSQIYHELDFVNEKAYAVVYTQAIGFDSKYETYKDGAAVHTKTTRIGDSDWEEQETSRFGTPDEFIEVYDRLKAAKNLKLLREERIYGSDTYVISSEMTEEEALTPIRDLFKGAVIGPTTNEYILKKGENIWWVDKEKKLVLYETRYIDAELDGHPIMITFESKYYDYNQDIEILAPENLTT